MFDETAGEYICLPDGRGSGGHRTASPGKQHDGLCVGTIKLPREGGIQGGWRAKTDNAEELTNRAPASSLASYRLCKRYVKRNRFPLFMLYTPGGLSWKDGRRDEQIAHMSPARETHDDHGSRL